MYAGAETIMKIQFPVMRLNDEDELVPVMSEEFSPDECLEFFSDGTIHSNGGKVDPGEIETSEGFDLIPEYDRDRIWNFLNGDFSEGSTPQ
jgi:predicted component of viral defense system (DUF524 family)